MDRADKKAIPMTPDETRAIFELASSGRGQEAAQRHLSGRNRVTINRAYNVVVEFERRGLTSLDDSTAESIAATAKYSTTVTYVKNLFPQWRTWRIEIVASTTLTDPLNHVLEEKALEHVCKLSKVAGEFKQQLRLPPPHAAGSWVPPQGSSYGVHRVYTESQSIGVHPYYVWEPQEAEPGIFRLVVEGDLYFQCLQEHMPDDELWPWFEEWKTASAAYLYDCRQLLHWIIEECQRRTGTGILLDSEWPQEGIFWYFAQRVYLHCTYLAGGYRGLKGLAYETIEAPSRLPGQGTVHTLWHGGVLAVHGEDDELVMYNYLLAQQRGLWDWHNVHMIHSKTVEDLAFRSVLRLAERTGVGLYFVHVTAKEGLDAIAEARSRSMPVYGEVLTLALSFNCEQYKEPDGMKYHTYPSLKYEDDRQDLWKGLLREDLTFTATDSSFTTYLDKIAGRNVVDVRGGNIGIEIRMGVNYTEAVVKRGMSLEHYAAITSTNAAKLLGMYPQKGAIAPGSDADITIIDPSVKKKLSMSDLHVRDYSPWEGWDVAGWPTTVILRGNVMVDNGQLVGGPSVGRLISRKISNSVLQRPAF